MFSVIFSIFHRLLLRSRSGPGGTGLPGELPGPRVVDAKVDVLDGGDTVVGDDAAQQSQSRDARPLAQEAANTLVDCFFTEGAVGDRLVNSLGTTLQFSGMRLGADPTLEMQALPPNAETLLLPAAEGVIEHQEALANESPTALRDADPKKMATVLQGIQRNNKILDLLAALVYGIKAQNSQYQQYLDRSLRGIYWNGASAEMNRNFALGTKLKALGTWMNQPSQLAQESRKANEKLAEQVEAQTLDRVHGGTQDPAAPPANPAPGPGTPPASPPVYTRSPGVQGPIAVKPVHQRTHAPAKSPGKTGTSGGGTRRSKKPKPA